MNMLNEVADRRDDVFMLTGARVDVHVIYVNKTLFLYNMIYRCVWMSLISIWGENFSQVH